MDPSELLQQQVALIARTTHGESHALKQVLLLAFGSDLHAAVQGRRQLTNRALHVRTGVLRGSVNANTTSDGSKITGTVSSSAGPTFYGKFHEYGVPHAWEIVATKSRALRFQMGVKANARAVFSRSIVHPPLPQRSFMRATLEENREEITKALARAVADVLKEK